MNLQKNNDKILSLNDAGVVLDNTKVVTNDMYNQFLLGILVGLELKSFLDTCGVVVIEVNGGDAV